METSQSDPLSYYQIAGKFLTTSLFHITLILTPGIHGRPYLPWDGVGTAPGDGGGYCTHTSNLFLTWHRPYLALYEASSRAMHQVPSC